MTLFQDGCHCPCHYHRHLMFALNPYFGKEFSVCQSRCGQAACARGCGGAWLFPSFSGCHWDIWCVGNGGICLDTVPRVRKVPLVRIV